MTLLRLAYLAPVGRWSFRVGHLRVLLGQDDRPAQGAPTIPPIAGT